MLRAPDPDNHHSQELIAAAAALAALPGDAVLDAATQARARDAVAGELARDLLHGVMTRTTTSSGIVRAAKSLVS